MKRFYLILAGMLLLLTGCGEQNTTIGEPVSPMEEMVVFTDDLGREASVAPPTRVATLIGSFADIWCLAGGRDTLAASANDTWTSFDLGLDSGVADLGAVKEPNLEVLLAAQPDLVIGSVSTQADLELEPTLTQAGIPVAYFDVDDFDDYLRMLEICTRLTGHPENYTLYGENVAIQVEAAIARQNGSAPRVLCMRATGSSCKVKGSEGTVLGEMLAALGCVNIADSDASLLEELSLEAIIAADPDYIFVALQGSDPTKATSVEEIVQAILAQFSDTLMQFEKIL